MDTIPTKETFELIQTLNLDEIVKLPPQQTRLILPCLVRMCLCDTLDVSERWQQCRQKLNRFLLSFQEVNDIKLLLGFNYTELEAEVKKEMQFRLKSGSQVNDSLLLAGIPAEQGLVNPFEIFDCKTRMKIMLSELISLMNATRNYAFQPNLTTTGPHPSELFDSDIYLDEILDLMFFAISEMPNTFQLYEVVEALLLLRNGLKLICCLIANFPDSFHEICMALINNGGNNEEDSFFSMNRVRVLRSLCQMNPNEALLIRGEAVELCRMPNLVVMLTLDHIKQCEAAAAGKSTNSQSMKNSKTDVISFITGILLSNDDKVRSWFSQYIKTSQKKTITESGNSFHEFRAVLLARFKAVTELVANLSNNSNNNSADKSNSNKQSTESELILTEACIMLRLYCALRGVASMKFTDEETLAICRMIICRPRHSYIGVRFVSFGLCMILAFPQLVTVPENEGKIVEWIKWLVQEESYLGKVSGMKSSFGEMLLLIAIHFHSNQMSAIGELVSSTIGIKLPIRINDLNRIKNIFTQEIFTDQTVAAHAIKVPVTRHLNNSVSGFLPVHCIYQLLKSRAFTKNKVPIKDWIFKQIRNSVAPIHPILPQLIEAYVNSILIPNTASFHLTNEPIAEEDIAAIFARKVYSIEENEQEEESEGDEEEEDEEDEDQDERMEMDDDETEDEADHSSGSKSKLKVDDDEEVACVLTSQLLLLYYVLLYEDVRLANMKAIVANDRKVLKYSEEFITQLPIFYLVQKTRTCKTEYGVLMPPLLRLLAFHYPHLCLVKDWLPNSVALVQLKSLSGVGGKQQLARFGGKSSSRPSGAHHKKSISISTKREREKFLKAFKPSKSAEISYNLVNDAFERLLHLPDEYLWPLAQEFVPKLSLLLKDSVPRVVAMNAKTVWFRLNHIFPTKLWLMTVNALSQHRNEAGRHFSMSSSWSEIVMNPMLVLNCDRRVFRMPELMEITLHILSGFLLASRILQTHYLMEKPSRNLDEEKKREELKVTLQSLTESTAIQCLLECCLLKESDFPSETAGEESSSDSESEDEDRSSQSSSSRMPAGDRGTLSSKSATDPRWKAVKPNMLSNLREVQGLIFNHLHQCFIADVNLAKLVHFQGYRRELLPLVVAGIPSMHICLDFLPELLNQLELDKQSFAMDLCSHLCTQYPIQRFFNVAKLCLAIAVTHLSVLPSARRAEFYLAIIPPLQRMCTVFPPLIEEFVKLLVQLAQKNKSRLNARPTMNLFGSLDAFSLSLNSPGTDQCNQTSELINMEWNHFSTLICSKMEPEEALSLTIHKAFASLCHLGLMSKVFKEEDLL